MVQREFGADRRPLPLAWRAASYVTRGRALLVDRDGVINQKIEGGYVLNAERDLRFVSSFIKPARLFSKANIPIIVLSNQSCIGRGLIDVPGMEHVMSAMIEELAAQDVVISGYVICPHTPAQACDCRKPAPGLLLDAAARFDLHLWNCVFIGDDASDLAAAQAAGCPGTLVDAARPGEFTHAFHAALAYIAQGAAA